MPRPLNMDLVARCFDGKLKETKPSRCVYCGHQANGGGRLCVTHAKTYRLWRSNYAIRELREGIAKAFGLKNPDVNSRLTKKAKALVAKHKVDIVSRLSMLAKEVESNAVSVKRIGKLVKLVERAK